MGSYRYSKYLRHTFDTFKRRTTGAIIIGSCADLLLYAGSNYLNIRILKLDGRYTFVPIAVETFGPLNREGLDFLSVMLAKQSSCSRASQRRFNVSTQWPFKARCQGCQESTISVPGLRTDRITTSMWNTICLFI